MVFLVCFIMCIKNVASNVEEGDTGNFESDYHHVYALDSKGEETEITDKILDR